MKGWKYDNYRHSLASRGIKTRTSYYGKSGLNGQVLLKSRHGIPITVKDTPRPGRAYPLSPKDVKDAVDKLPDHDVDGVKEINFRDPSDVAGSKQHLAYAQWVRTKEKGGNRINVFSQPYNGGQFREVEPGNEDPEMLRAHMKNYVIPHEVGHHVAAKKDNKLPIVVEEAKADAYAAKENPDNPSVVEKHINHRVKLYGPSGTI